MNTQRLFDNDRIAIGTETFSDKCVQIEPLIDELIGLMGDTVHENNRRKHERIPWITTSAVWIEQGINTNRFAQHQGITTHDLSKGGFSFLHHQHLHAGAKIKLRLDLLPKSPVLLGIVRNCERLDGLHHRVSVMFTNIAENNSTK